MRPIHRLLAWSAVGACALSLAACGGNDDEATNPLRGQAPTTLTPRQAQAPPADVDGYVDGYLITADEPKVVLKTGEGEQTSDVAAEDVAALGIGHLQSHAGSTPWASASSTSSRASGAASSKQPRSRPRR